MRTKKSLDTWLGLPVLFVVSGFTRLYKRAFAARELSRLPANTIVVSKFQGMGSVILAKPALLRLRQKFPDARLVFWGTEATAAIAREMPEFDEIVVLDDTGFWACAASLSLNLWALRRLKVDWFFDLEVYSKLSSVFAWLTPARNRAGFAVTSVRQRGSLHTHLVTFNRYEYLGVAYQRLLGLLIGEAPPQAGRPVEFGDWKTKLTALPKLSGLKYAAVNIHAGELSLERKWPRESFEAFIVELLKGDPSLWVVLLGHGEGEARETRLIPKHERVVDLSNQLTLAETLRCLANAKLVVSNDSAPLHMALSMRMPSLGLFGPTRLESYLPPHQPRAVGISKKLYCSPCVHHWEPPSCGGNNVCMKTITVGEVLDEACRLLGLPEPSMEIFEPRYVIGKFYPGLVRRE